MEDNRVALSATDEADGFLRPKLEGLTLNDFMKIFRKDMEKEY